MGRAGLCFDPPRGRCQAFRLGRGFERAHCCRLCAGCDTRAFAIGTRRGTKTIAPPLCKGMRRANPKERARDRILDDDEIRAVWQAAEENGTFGAFVRVVLLPPRRREKVAAMRWAGSRLDGVWPYPAEAREKGTANELVARGRARDHQGATTLRIDPYSSPDVAVRIFGDSKGKAAIRCQGEHPGWRLHDLRRTARSLMSRAGVRPDIAERVLGHAITGVEGVYDRHSYRDEKAHALKALAGLIENILRPEFGQGAPAAGLELHMARVAYIVALHTILMAGRIR